MSPSVLAPSFASELIAHIPVAFQAAVVFLLTTPSPPADANNLSGMSASRSGQALPLELTTVSHRRMSRETADSDNRVIKLRLSKLDLADEAPVDQGGKGKRQSLDGDSVWGRRMSLTRNNGGSGSGSGIAAGGSRLSLSSILVRPSVVHQHSDDATVAGSSPLSQHVSQP